MLTPQADDTSGNTTATTLTITVTREEFENKVYTYRCITFDSNLGFINDPNRVISNEVTVDPPERPSNLQLQLQSPNMLFVEVDEVCFERKSFEYEFRPCGCVQRNGIQNLTNCIEYPQSSEVFNLDLEGNGTYNVSCTVTIDGSITLNTATVLVSAFDDGFSIVDSCTVIDMNPVSNGEEETLNVAGVVVGILVPLLIVVVLMVLVAVLAISYRKQLHCKYRRWKSKKYGPKDDPKETTEVVVLSDKRPITVPSDSEIVMPKTCPLPSSISSQPDNVKISEEVKTVTIVEDLCEELSLRKRGDLTNIFRSEVASASSEEQGKVDPEPVAESNSSDSATLECPIRQCYS